MPEVNGRDIRTVVIACDAGMGSSVMVASQMRQRLKKYDVAVEHLARQLDPRRHPGGGHPREPRPASAGDGPRRSRGPVPDLHGRPGLREGRGSHQGRWRPCRLTPPRHRPPPMSSFERPFDWRSTPTTSGMRCASRGRSSRSSVPSTRATRQRSWSAKARSRPTWARASRSPTGPTPLVPLSAGRRSGSFSTPTGSTGTARPSTCASRSRPAATNTWACCRRLPRSSSMTTVRPRFARPPMSRRSWPS